ncbi:hypothetical protein Tco_1101697 [Tanacetum coccineum]
MRYKPVEQTSVAKKPERQIPIVHSEHTNGSNNDIMNQYECKQTLDVSTGTLNIHAGTSLNPTKEGLRVGAKKTDIENQAVPKVVPPADKTATSRQELELLFHHHITMLRSYALSWKPCQGDSLNLPDHKIHKDGDGDALFQLKSDSLPHAHAQTTKTYYKHRDSRIKDKDFRTNSDIQDLPSKISSLSREIVSKLSR